jgi:ABC-type multidrug transport system fused ATPase/permease subunit
VALLPGLIADIYSLAQRKRAFVSAPANSPTNQQVSNQPATPEKRLTNWHRYLMLLGYYLRPQRGKAISTALLLLAGIGLQLAVPQLLRRFIDTVAAGADQNTLTVVAVIFLVVALTNQAITAFATYLSADVGWTATNAMRLDLLEHCYNLDMHFHNDRRPGELIERIDGDVTALSNFFSQFSVQVLGGILLMIGILITLWLESLLMGFALTTFTIIVTLLLHRLQHYAVPASELEREASAQLYGFVEERIAGLDDLRANGAGQYALNGLHQSLRHFYQDTTRAWLLRSHIWISMVGLSSLGYILVIALSVVLYQQGHIRLSTGLLFLQYMGMLEQPLEQLTLQLQDLQKAAASIGRIDALFAESSQLSVSPTPAVMPQGVLSVDIDQVHFAYRDATVLDDVSMHIAAGRTLGLLGRTGSGKTSLTKLLFRLYDPTTGSVRLGGQDVRDVDIHQLRQSVGMVTQDVQLFHASVRDNVRFFDASITDDQIRAVLDELGLAPWLDSLPAGLDSQLEPGGKGLSAGQAQLLAFARVFLKDPGLVILDEPSSRLDPATEALLDCAVERLLQGRTAIIIAHRLDTIARADDIAILADGKLIEHGERKTLKARADSHFARLLASHQALAFSDGDVTDRDMEDRNVTVSPQLT